MSVINSDLNATAAIASPSVFGKRALDLLISAPLLLLLMPLFLLVALLIKLDSRGPIFFTQRRNGCNEKSFLIYKFRSMSVVEDSVNVRQAVKNDPRVTTMGRFLRRTNIDELPQLLNVLKGEMSLVGPRPHAMIHDAECARRVPHYCDRFLVRPGLTGWAQVNGHRGPTDTEEKLRARVAHDLFYVEHASLRFDLKILALTLLSRKAFNNAH
jgi:lipopolysaccharide/colanic/teichoic acid biosynthesis glycosyltransferase